MPLRSHCFKLALACLAAVTVAGVSSAGSRLPSSSSSSSSTSRPLRELLHSNDDCNCADQQKPVCGADGKTYANQCQLQCVAGVELAYQGACQGGSASPAKPPPASAKPNAGAGPQKSPPAKPAPAGPAAAEPGCRCTKQLKQVCGSDGKTYDNACLALCQPGVLVAAAGACIDGAPKLPACSPPCPAQSSPVCGEDLRTYANPCHAGCKGVKILAKTNCMPINFSDDVEGRLQGKPEAAPVAATAVGQSAQNTTPGGINPNCMCMEAYMPVCTTTGITRSNECKAACRGEKVAYRGECEPQAVPAVAAGAVSRVKPPRNPDCVCAALYAPVCGEDGNTYSNRCEATCHAVNVAAEGQCEAQTAATSAEAPSSCAACPDTYQPVCGANSLTYYNACKLRCEGKTTLAHQGACTPAQQTGGTKPAQPQQSADITDCLARCPTDGKPACALNGQTYPSSCMAKCYNLELAYPGPCKNECAACPTDWNPYCIATSQFGPRTFANCCFAKCNGVNIMKNVLYPQACRDSCKQCDQMKENPLCCGGRTYKNGCYALCNTENTANCSPGRCSSVAGVEDGIGCLLGACPVKCNGYIYQHPVCGSDGRTYPDKCALMCSQTTAIVAPGKCGTCAPGQPGGFPYCSSSDVQGLAPVCGVDGVTYRNSYAAKQAGVRVASGGPCDRMCGEEGEACFPSSSPSGSTCCQGLRCSRNDGGGPDIVQEGSKAAATGVCTS